MFGWRHCRDVVIYLNHLFPLARRWPIAILLLVFRLFAHLAGSVRVSRSEQADPTVMNRLCLCAGTNDAYH